MSLALVLLAAASAGSALAADVKVLKRLEAPSPATIMPLASDAAPRTVKFARIAVQLRPEPWAYMSIASHSEGGADYAGRDDVLTWQDGQIDLKPSTVSSIIGDELKAAHVPIDQGEESLFAQNSASDFQLAVRVTEMSARFCQYCTTIIFAKPTWTGAVVMTARWELYSNLERKVVATVETHGGFTAPKGGLAGDPVQLIYEALRDNARRLTAASAFREAVLSPLAGRPASAAASAAPITLAAITAARPLSDTTKAVAVVFAGDGSGSGFLVSTDGYLLTNHHVVGAAKYVKLKWADGTESLGEVIRTDPRRDVALVKTDARGRRPLGLRRGDLQLGDTVFAVGTPLDDKFQNTLTKGIISGLRTYEGQPFIQSDVAVTHGNSGGPLLDERGAVVGLTVSGIEPNGAPVGLNFFIPIEDALRALALKPGA